MKGEVKEKHNMREELRKLRALVMMQLKNKLDLSYFNNKKKAFLKIMLQIIGFVALTAIIYVLFYFASVLRIFSFGVLLPTNIIVVLFTLMMLLSIISCSFSLMKALYFSSDNQVLFTLPVTRTEVFVSKLIVFYINELKRSVTFILPLFIAYGLVNSLPLYFYPWLIFCLFIVALIPVALGAIISIPLMGLVLLLRRHKILEIICVLAGIALITWGVVAVINIIPENINIVGSWGTIYWDIQDFLSLFAQIFYPFTHLTHMIIGGISNLSVQLFNLNTLFELLAFLGSAIAILGLSFVIVRPLFFTMATKMFEHDKKIVKKELKNHKSPALWSGIKKEFLDIVRTPSKWLTLLATAIGMPVAILLLNTIFSAMSVRLVGTYMTIAFNVLIIALISLSSSSAMAHVYSEEGNAHYLYKTNPQSYHKSLLPKITINGVVMTLSIVASVIVFSDFSSVSAINCVYLTLFLVFFYVGHLFWSAEMDIMQPQYDQYQSTGYSANNTNEGKSVLLAFIISFLVCGVLYFLINENSATVYWKVLLISIGFLVYRAYMFFKRVKLYYIKPYKQGVK